MRQTAKGKIIEGYLDKYPEMPSLTMAKLIVKDNPLDFKDVETVRANVRKYRGKSGDKARAQNVRGGKHYKPKDEINFAPFNMPAAISVDYTPFILPKAHNNIGFIGDVHMPNHRPEVVALIIEHLKRLNINTLVLNGDILDNTPFTRHDGKRPTATQVREWFDMTEMFFESLREYFPDVAIYWFEGNHDFWYRRWMQAHAWQLDDDPYFSLQERLHIDEYKIKFIPQEQYGMAGKLSIHHGHLLMGKFGGGVSPARTVFLKTQKSVVIGHVHYTDEYTNTNLHGDIVTCWSVGCACTLTPDYQPIAGRANHGFGHAIIEKNGDYQFKNYRIHKGKIL